MSVGNTVGWYLTTSPAVRAEDEKSQKHMLFFCSINIPETEISYVSKETYLMTNSYYSCYIQYQSNEKSITAHALSQICIWIYILSDAKWALLSHIDTQSYYWNFAHLLHSDYFRELDW